MYPCILTLSHHAPQAFVLLEIAGLNDAGKHVRKEQSSGQNHGFNEQVYGWKLDRMFLWWGWSNSIYQRTFLPQIDQSMAISLFWVGFRSKVIGANGEPELFWFIYLGVKGDWPWLRKSMGLFTGPTSRRICHLCSQKAAVLHKAYVSDFCPLKKIFYEINWYSKTKQNSTIHSRNGGILVGEGVWNRGMKMVGKTLYRGKHGDQYLWMCQGHLPLLQYEVTSHIFGQLVWARNLLGHPYCF